MFRKYQSTFERASASGSRSDIWKWSAGNADSVPGAGCGQGQWCSLPLLPQSSFSGRSLCASQHVLPSFFNSFLQHSPSFPQANAVVVGITVKAKTNSKGNNMTVKVRKKGIFITKLVQILLYLYNLIVIFIPFGKKYQIKHFLTVKIPQLNQHIHLIHFLIRKLHNIVLGSGNT